MVLSNVPNGELLEAEKVTLRVRGWPAEITAKAEGLTCTYGWSSGTTRTSTSLTVSDEVKETTTVILWPLAISPANADGVQEIVGAAGAGEGVKRIAASARSPAARITIAILGTIRCGMRIAIVALRLLMV